jgi:hypothetical protein
MHLDYDPHTMDKNHYSCISKYIQQVYDGIYVIYLYIQVYAKNIPNRLLNEIFLYVLENLHTSQSQCALQFTSADPAFVKEMVERVYPAILATATAPEMPVTRAFSRQLIAYIRVAAFLPVGLLDETADQAFQGLHDPQDPRMVPALWIPSPFRHGRLLPRRGGRRGDDDRPSRRGAGGVGRRRELVRAPRGRRQ